MLHDKIHEKHKFTKKLRSLGTSIHNKMYK